MVDPNPIATSIITMVIWGGPFVLANSTMKDDGLPDGEGASESIRWEVGNRELLLTGAFGALLLPPPSSSFEVAEISSCCWGGMSNVDDGIMCVQCSDRSAVGSGGQFPIGSRVIISYNIIQYNII